MEKKQANLPTFSHYHGTHLDKSGPGAEGTRQTCYQWLSRGRMRQNENMFVVGTAGLFTRSMVSGSLTNDGLLLHSQNPAQFLSCLFELSSARSGPAFMRQDMSSAAPSCQGQNVDQFFILMQPLTHQRILPSQTRFFFL